MVSINQRFSLSSIEIQLFPVDGLIVLAEALFHSIDCCQGNGMFISYRLDRDYVKSHLFPTPGRKMALFLINHSLKIGPNSIKSI